MPILCMFPVHDVLPLVTSLFHIQPHAKRPWESDQQPLSENARKLHFFGSNLSRSPRLLFSMPQPFQNQYDWLPTSHGWCPHLHVKFLDSTAPGPKIQKKIHAKTIGQWSHVLKRVQDKTVPNCEILQPPSPLHCKPLILVWIVRTRCQCMSMWQYKPNSCMFQPGKSFKIKIMLKTFHLETVESLGITKHTGICNVDATNCSYIVQTRPKYSGWFHVSNTATTRPMRFKLHSKMFSKSALPVVHFSSKIRCWLFTKKHMKKNLAGVPSTQIKKTIWFQENRN